MKILSMTATFGKLEHETLTLQPGLNIIHAPNEWGKSTWCAFLIAMLYGMDTRAHTTKTALADKERYAPWSGAPMSGRMDILWKGKQITIERRTKGRAIMGAFSAYETQTGLPVPELTAANCGSVLLGVEKSVFTRTGFLKLTDLPVDQDDALRRRLNALVTTGDESGTADALAQKLKDLKNRCRFNRTGLLPQAEAQRDDLSRKLQELSSLQQQSAQITQRQKALEEQIALLENHKTALLYAASRQNEEKVSRALQAQQQAQASYDSICATCDGLPSREQAQKGLATAQALQQQYLQLQQEKQQLPPLPEISAAAELPPESAVAQAKADYSEFIRLERNRKRRNRIFIGVQVAAVLIMGIAIACFALDAIAKPVCIAVGAATLLADILSLFLSIRFTSRYRDQLDVVFDRHPGLSPDRWVTEAQSNAAAKRTLLEKQQGLQAQHKAAQIREAALLTTIEDFTGGEDLAAREDYWMQILASHDALAAARRELEQAKMHANALRSMVKPATAPAFPDTLTYSEAETARLLSDSLYEQRQLELRLGQCLGQMERIGNQSALNQQLQAVAARIEKLEDTYAALTLAQQTLADASAQLQRRFAPRIAQRAQELFGKLTQNRYDRLTLSEDLSLNAAAADEDTLRSSLWRSDGTVDQLYLALRLAVARELTPDAPLVLDDALVRFDDQRLAAAMQILKEEATDKQVLLFTCQQREAQY